ncbi:MAG: hypothetical protein ACI88G_001256 [Woeseiaceae bacterium]|jgi:hypothetical protein
MLRHFCLSRVGTHSYKSNKKWRNRTHRFVGAALAANDPKLRHFRICQILEPRRAKRYIRLCPDFFKLFAHTAGIFVLRLQRLDQAKH